MYNCDWVKTEFNNNFNYGLNVFLIQQKKQKQNMTCIEMYERHTTNFNNI